MADSTNISYQPTAGLSYDPNDAVYWDVVRSFDEHVRGTLMGGARHVHESEMKDRRRTDGLPGHEQRPDPDS